MRRVHLRVGRILEGQIPMKHKLEKLIPLPPSSISDLELYSSNLMTREEIKHQNDMIRYRNQLKKKRALRKRLSTPPT